MTSLPFFRGDLRIAGRLFRNTDRVDVRQPAVIVTGSWLTVKEQMPETYARALAERGYAAFTFDFTGFGESAGEPRQAEIPDRKIADLVAAADFVATLSIVEPDTLAHLAICASAHGLAALARIAGATVRQRRRVVPRHGERGAVLWRAGRRRVAACAGERRPRSLYRHRDDRHGAGLQGRRPDAAMFFELDYYANPARGAVPAWKNEMATLSWRYWFMFDGLRAAEHVRTPALFVHSDGCVFPDNVRTIEASCAARRNSVWAEGTQTDFYDQPAQVERAVNAADAFLKGID